MSKDDYTLNIWSETHGWFIRKKKKTQNVKIYIWMYTCAFKTIVGH